MHHARNEEGCCLARRATLLAVTHALLDMTYKRTQMDCQNKPIRAHGFLGASRKPMHGLEVYPHLHNRSKCIGIHEGRLALSHDCASSSADEPIPSFATIAPSRMVLFKNKALSLYCKKKERQVHGFFKVSKNPIQGSLVPSHIRHWAIGTRRRMRGKLLPWHYPSPLRMCFHNPSMYWVPPTTSRILPFGKVTVCGMVYLGSSHLPCLSFFFWWTTRVCTQPST